MFRETVKEATTECDICGQEAKNSDELEKHKEHVHPPDNTAGQVERPDLLGDTPEESSESTNPQPLH